jgi:hypothetical protein
MKTIPPKDAINEPINPTDVTYIVCLRTVGGGETLFLGRRELDQYNRDPDAFAARHFGLKDVAEYHEWIASNGTSLCSERMRNGKLCSNQIGMRHERGLQYWREHHRTEPCRSHGGDEREKPPPRWLGRYPVAADRRCEALTRSQDTCDHQCGLSGTHVRDGRRVCHMHRDCADVDFIDGGRT